MRLVLVLKPHSSSLLPIACAAADCAPDGSPDISISADPEVTTAGFEVRYGWYDQKYADGSPAPCCRCKGAFSWDIPEDCNCANFNRADCQAQDWCEIVAPCSCWGYGEDGYKGSCSCHNRKFFQPDGKTEDCQAQDDCWWDPGIYDYSLSWPDAPNCAAVY